MKRKGETRYQRLVISGCGAQSLQKLIVEILQILQHNLQDVRILQQRLSVPSLSKSAHKNGKENVTLPIMQPRLPVMRPTVPLRKGPLDVAEAADELHTLAERIVAPGHVGRNRFRVFQLLVAVKHVSLIPARQRLSPSSLSSP